MKPLPPRDRAIEVPQTKGTPLELDTSQVDPTKAGLLEKFELDQVGSTPAPDKAELGLLKKAKNALDGVLARLGIGSTQGLGAKVGKNLRALVDGLRQREERLVGHVTSLISALGLAAIHATTLTDLRQLYDFAKGTISAGKPMEVVSPLLDVLGFVVKYPEEARKLLGFMAKTEKDAWAQRSSWQGGPKTEAPAKVDIPRNKLPLKKTDVVVIGAGLGGGSAARELASAFAKGSAAPQDVLVIDRSTAAAHERAASLRNGGVVCTVLDYLFDIHEAIGNQPIAQIQKDLSLSRPEAEQAYHALMKVLYESSDRIFAFLREKNVDLEFQVKGSIDVAHAPGDLAAFKEAALKAQELGMDWSAADAATMAAKYGLDESRIEGGLIFNRAGQLHPGKLVKALLEHAQETSDRIKTQWETEVLSAEPKKTGDGWLIHTNRGDIEAKQVIDAREAFAPYSWGEGHYSQIHVIKVDADSGPMKLGDTSLCNKFTYMRKIGEGEFLVGSGDMPVEKGQRPPPPLASIALYAAASFKKIYPDVPFDIERVWGGVFGVSKDGLPVTGKLAEGWYVIGGAGGTGLSYTPVLAKQAVGEMLGLPDQTPLHQEEVFGPRRFFLQELRHDLLRVLEELPQHQGLDLEQVRVQVVSGKAGPPRSEDGRLVFSVSEATLDKMNTDVALIFAGYGSGAIESREKVKSDWIAAQTATLI